MRKNYDPSVDYSKKIQEAADRGDLEQAAYYEEKRNEKIKGEGLTQYALTHNYEAFLPKTTAQKMEQVLEKLNSREPFTYDPGTDKLYLHFKDQYTKAGALAKEDAQAQAAALTGGYGNSYGQTLGQEAYDREMDRLTNLVPELYDRAKETYDQEGETILGEYDRLAKDLDRQQAEAARLDQEEYKRQKEQEDREYQQQKAERDKAYSLALSMLNQGLMPSQDILGKSGIDPTDAEKLYGANLPKETPSGSASGSSSSGSSASGSGKGQSGTAFSSATKEDKGKTLTHTMWEKLRNAYRNGSKSEDLTDFLQLRSMMEAQGYDVAAFDRWARSAYGKGYTSGGKKVIDGQSVLALGYGPIGEDKLAQLLALGEIEQYTAGDYIYYRKTNKSPSSLTQAVIK